MTAPDHHVSTDDPARIEVIREATTMALYVSLSLLAVMVALPPAELAESETPVIRVALTSIGLVLAHVVAFRISSRFVHHGVLTVETTRLLGAQLAGGLGVTVIACIPLVALDGPMRVEAAQSAVLLIIAGVAFAAARTSGASRARAFAYVAGVVVVVGIVLMVKNLVPH